MQTEKENKNIKSVVPVLEKGGFSANDLASFCPVPNRRLESKFRYFYKPYSYQTNTHKHIDFSSDDDLPEDNSCPPAHPDLKC